MADDYAFTPGTGAIGAADDIGGVLYPRAKLSLGADGSAVDAVGGAGAVGTDVQRVTLASNDPAVAALQVIDDWDETNRAAVNIIAGQVGVQGGSGSTNALTQRVVLATDVALPAGTNAIGKLAANAGVIIGSVDVNSHSALVAGSAIIGNVGIDQTTPGTTNGVVVTTALPAGTNAIGKLSANSGVDIGDVDVTSLPALAAGTNNIGDVDVLTLPVAFNAGSASATTVRIVSATDDPVVAGVGGTSDAAATAGSTGSVNAKLRLATTQLDAVSTAVAIMDDWDESDRAKVNIIAGQVGVAGGTGTDSALTQRVTLATNVGLPAGEAFLGAVGGKTVVKNLTMTTDTSAYASGDVIADTQQLDAAFRITDGKGVLQSLVLIDESDQKAALTVNFHDTSTSLGTENAAPSISDANAIGYLGSVDIATGDYRDWGGVSVVCLKGIGLPISAASGTDDLYVSILNSTGTPTYGATAIKLRLGILQD
jgi:hypothetical protein